MQLEVDAAEQAVDTSVVLLRSIHLLKFCLYLR